MVEIGRLIGIDKIIYGRVSSTSNQERLNLFVKVVDVNTSVLDFSDYLEIRSDLPYDFSYSDELSKRNIRNK